MSTDFIIHEWAILLFEALIHEFFKTSRKAKQVLFFLFGCGKL